ncbi:MAG: ABC transporter permease [Pseudorhodoplanes sp.]
MSDRTIEDSGLAGRPPALPESVLAADRPPARPHWFRGLIQVLRASPLIAVGGGIVAFWIAAALLAPWLTHYGPTSIDYTALAEPWPSAKHWLGVDPKGRDILSRIMWGARTVLAIAPAAVVSAYVVGCALGVTSAYFGGVVDLILSRVGDIILSFPVLVLYILLITTVGPSAFNIILAITVAASPGIARLARSQVLMLRERDYVAAAKMRGESSLYIMFVELLPNARGPLILDACVRLGWTTIAIGTLGFLGLGLPPPTPDWGGMIKEGAAVLLIWPHMAIFPCIALASLIVGFNLFSEGIRALGGR